MDEPTSSLADHEVEILYGVIRQLREAGMSVIFVRHSSTSSMRVCDRVTVNAHGRSARSRHGSHRQLEPGRAMLGPACRRCAARPDQFHGEGHAPI